MTGVRPFQMEFEFESAFDEMGKLEKLKKNLSEKGKNSPLPHFP